MKSFSFKRDIKHVQWKRTLWVNFLRSLSAGLVWAIIMLISGKPMEGHSMPVSMLIMLFGLPVIYFIFFFPLSYAFGLLSKIHWIFGLCNIGMALILILGDPILFILSKVRKDIVPVEDYGFVNFYITIFVIDPKHLASISN